MIRYMRLISPLLLLALATTALSMTVPAGGIQVGPGGLKLYPRWNKAFAPITSVEEGATLTVLKERGPWKQVEVDKSKKRGWIYANKKTPTTKVKVNLPIAASPTTSGLVVKGWSSDYAAKNGADIGKVGELMTRSLDFDGFNRFKTEGGLK